MMGFKERVNNSRGDALHPVDLLSVAASLGGVVPFPNDLTFPCDLETPSPVALTQQSVAVGQPLR